ncbi:cytochrome b/b6 domain-containing protein [Kordiimonas gwangyangensis]|uniref:cytochrome b/b6 domain-containing protein n=1 Tax=Kordiimonas gwangyangensis TaxID=288022 RepID=UPI000382902E|nr:cytochrome b/b6 domain-containing protein [Kordiimonas gwangyangensis]
MKIKVWDGGTRLFHWVLVLLFALSSYSAFQDKFGIYADIHVYSGVAILALVIWRVLWGLIGSETSRFSHFLRGPKATLDYAKGAMREAPYARVGHNPLGGLSVLLMLLLLAAQTVLGLYSTDAMLFSGPLADSIDSGFAEDLTEVHEIIGFTLMGLVGVHILAIIAYGVRRKANLVGPMITGTREVNEGVSAPKIANPLLALVLFAAVAAAVWYGIF